MRLNEELRYPGTQVDTVHAMLIDPAFHERVCAALHADDVEVKVTPSGNGGAEVLVQRSLPTEAIPDFLRSFVGSRVTVVERTQWTAVGSHYDGTMHVSIAGTPVSMNAKTRLAASGDDVVQTLDGDIKASVPLMGGRIEKAVEPAIRGAAKLQEKVGRQWLSQGA